MSGSAELRGCSHPRWIDVLPLDDSPITAEACVRCGMERQKPTRDTAALPTEQVRALVRLLYPDHMTPTAKRLFEAACHEVEDPPDEDMQQGCS